MLLKLWKDMAVKWKDAQDGSKSELVGRIGDGLNGFGATVRQPDERLRNWDAAISLSSGGKSLSLESGKIDAVMALRRDAEKLVEALGGTVKWRK